MISTATFFPTPSCTHWADRQGCPIPPNSGGLVVERLEWDEPGSNLKLAQRWIEDLDENGVSRIGLIASLPGEENAVSEAVGHFPMRFVGQFMVDPTQPDATQRTRRGLGELGMQVVCLFPAMHHFRLDSDEAMAVFEIASELGRAAFVHCGVLSVGVRRKLELASPFDIRLGNPLDLQRAANAFPRLSILIPHFGAGFFREALMAADLHSGIYLDTSSSNSWIKYSAGTSLDTVFQTALDVLGPRRLVFGTDSSFFPRGWQRVILETQQKILADLGVPGRGTAAGLGGNFERLFPVEG